MKKVLTIICWALWFGTTCMPAQTASALNEGLVISSPVDGRFELSWWGKDGWTYFIEQSDDLIHWHFLPVIETIPSGMGDGVLTWGLSTNAPRSFFKLKMSNIPTEDAHSADFDGDGISNWDELQNATDPFDYYNGIPPTLRIVSGGNQWGPVNGVLPEPIAIEVGAGLANAPVVFTSDGAQLSPDGTGNWSNKVIIKSSPGQALVTARVYVKLPSTSNTVSQISAGVTTRGGSSSVATTASTSGNTLLPPTGYFASVLTTTSMRIEWTPTDPTRHTSIEISKDQGATWELLAVVDPGVQSFDVEELESGKKILFRLFTGDIRTVMPGSAAVIPAPANIVKTLVGWKERVIEIFYGKSMQITAPPGESSQPTDPFGDGPPLVIENVRWEESRYVSAEFGEDQGVGYSLVWSEQPGISLLEPDDSNYGIGRDHVAYEQKFRHAVDTFIQLPERGWPPEGFRGNYLPSMYSVFCGPYYYYDQVVGSVAGWTQVRLRSDHVLTEEDGPYSKTFLRAAWGGGQLNVTSAETLTILVGKDRSEPATLDPQWVTPFTFENDNGKFYLTTPTFNEVLIPVEVKWEAKPEFNNLDDHKDPWTNEINGKRIFPDAVAPQPSDWRREAIVKVRIPGLGGKEVHLKVFDVDDTSAIEDPEHILDSNDTSSQKAGDDNLTGEGLIAEWGQFLPDLAKQVTVTLDPNGEAEVEFRVNQQPGNNYRVAVALEANDLNYLHVSNSGTQGYVTSDNKSVNGFKGGISPMLTVWRKLHIEQDSMEAAPDPKPSPDQVQVTGSYWERQGPRSVLHLSGSLPEGTNFYQGGRIRSGSVEFDIYENTSSTITIGHGNNNIPTEAVFNAFIGQFDVFDDDERGTGPLLPNHNLITEGVKAKYRPAFIDVVTVEASLNTDKTMEFDANESPYWLFGTTDLDNNKDMGDSDSVTYWYSYVIAAYQGSPGEDNDPGGESLLEGITVWRLGSTTDFSAIFVEAIRDKLSLSLTDSNYMAKFVLRLDEVVAHEIGHVPSRQEGHYESGLMSDAGAGHDFAPESLLRFRKTPSWDASW